MRPYLSHPRTRVKEPVFHVSLNPNPKDKLNDNTLLEIAHYYMDHMGFRDQPYVIFRHNDTDRTHLHVISGCIRPDGSHVDLRYYKNRSMALTQEIETKFGLIPTIPGQEQKTFEELRKVEYVRGNLKAQFASVIRNLMDRYDFCSRGEFNTLLNLFNINVEECVGEVEGRSYKGVIYGALDDEGERIGKPIKSSRIGRDVGYKALQNHYEKTKKRLKDNPAILQAIRGTIREIMRIARTPEEFSTMLRPAKLAVRFHRNEQGRIYGVTFIDHHNHLVLNGSRLGKEFAANRFEELFLGKPPAEVPKTTRQSPIQQQPTLQTAIPQWEEISIPQKPYPVFDPLAELLDEATAPDPYEEWKRLQKKKKKRRRK